LTKEEKERRIIELLQKGANIREISKRVRMSFTDIGKISRKVSGYPEPAERSAVYSKHSQALELFRTGHSNLQVAIKVGLSDYETIEKQKQFRRLINMDKFCEFYDVMKDDLESYLQLYDELNNTNLTVRDTIEGLKYARWLESMKFEYGILQNRLQQMRDESFHVWLKLQGLKQEKDFVSNELCSLKVMTNNYSNEKYLPERPNEDISFVSRRRRRHQ
jgi:hypothetical protein